MQCPYTAKPPDGVSKRERDRIERKKEENERMDPNTEDGQKVRHVRDGRETAKRSQERHREKNGVRVN